MLLQPVDRRPLNVTGWSRFDKQAMTLGLDQETKYEHMSSLFIHHISLNQSGQFIYFLVRFHISQSNLQLVIWGFFVQNERDRAALIWSPIKVRFTLSELSHSLSFFHFWNTLGEHNEVYGLTCRTVLLLTQRGDSSCSWGRVGVLCLGVVTNRMRYVPACSWTVRARIGYAVITLGLDMGGC